MLGSTCSQQRKGQNFNDFKINVVPEELLPLLVRWQRRLSRNQEVVVGAGKRRSGMAVKESGKWRTMV